MNPEPAPDDLPALLESAGAGDEAAWRRLVGLYGRRVYGLLVRQCGDRELAEELTQMTFVTLVEKLGVGEGYREQGRFEAWLFRVAGNKLRDEMRRRKRQAEVVDMSPAATARGDHSGGGGGGGWAGMETRVRSGVSGAGTADGPSDRLALVEDLDRLAAAVASLPEADRQVLHLRHTAGLSFAQIAETLEQPLGTVLARAHRALGKLRKIMET